MTGKEQMTGRTEKTHWNQDKIPNGGSIDNQNFCTYFNL